MILFKSYRIARAACLPSLFLLIVIYLTGCQPQTHPQVSVTGQTMGTTYSIKLVGEGKALPESGTLLGWADTTFAAINQSMSTYIEDSELSLLNRAESEVWQPISVPLLDVLLLSQTISTKSDGAFDITVMPLVDLWGFGPKQYQSPPDTDTIRQTMEQIGFDKVSIDSTRGAIRKPKDVTLDLSAIAKGYAADQLAEKLRAEGYRHFMVEVGGELVLAGHNAEGKPWRIGIEMPDYQLLSGPRGPFNAVDITNKAMATSGDYRNYYEVEGVRFSHTIDPKSGRPITHNLASVTVIADTCAEADGWATALNVLGADKAMALALREQLAVFLIVREGEEFRALNSPAFSPYLVQNSD